MPEFAPKYNAATLFRESLRVGERELEAEATAPVKVFAFAKRSLRSDWRMRNEQGAEVGEIFRPFGRVGINVLGGGAPLVSTVLKTATLTQALGCDEIVVCTPCGKDGKR